MTTVGGHSRKRHGSVQKEGDVTGTFVHDGRTNERSFIPNSSSKSHKHYGSDEEDTKKHKQN